MKNDSSNTNSIFKIVAVVTLLFLAVGPLMWIIAGIMGGEIYSLANDNSSLEDFLIENGWYASVGGAVIAFVFSLVFAIIHKTEKRFIFLPIIALSVPLVLLVAITLIISSVHFCIDYPGECFAFS